MVRSRSLFASTRSRRPGATGAVPFRLDLIRFDPTPTEERMSKATSTTPKLSSMKYRIVGPPGTGAGSTILQISDKTAGGKRYALKVVKRQGPDDDVYVAQAQLEYEVSKKLK